MNIEKIIIETLKREVTPAIGCTEPGAVALATAKCRELLGTEELYYIDVFVSPNVYKNGLAVGVPPTDEVGLNIAAALGFVGGDSSKGLQVLVNINKEDLLRAKLLIGNDKIKLNIKDTKDKIYIEAIAYTPRGVSRVIIRNNHSNFVYLECRGTVLKDEIEPSKQQGINTDVLYGLTIKSIISVIEGIPSKDIEFLLEGLVMNERIAMLGLEKHLGMGVGFTLHESMKSGILSDDFMNHAKMLTAAASDARMSGINLPVMSSNGSGNNGLTAILPLVAYKRKFDVSEERLSTALAMSHIVNAYIKHYIGRLSALCGCAVASGTGAGVAIAWLMGATHDQIDGVIKNILGDISGMICDGAKVGCALKLSTSASSAIQAALLAINNKIIPAGNGIIADTVEETIKNLSILSNEGMGRADEVILKFMKQRKSMEIA